MSGKKSSTSMDYSYSPLAEDRSLKNGSNRGATNSHKKALYEPEGIDHCKQYVCSQRKAIVVLVLVLSCIVVVATVAALARPFGEQCGDVEITTSEKPVLEKSTEILDENGDTFPWQKIRLPETIVPIEYSLHLHPNLTTFKFTGKVEILITVNENTGFIIFHSKELKFSTMKLHELSDLDKSLVLGKIAYNKKYDQVSIKVPESLKSGKKYILILNFEGVVASALSGFYRSSYKTKSGEERWLATTHFEPTDARAAFPCFDEPHFKANFSMTMVRDKDHISLFNMPKKNTVERDDGLVEDVFEQSVKMSTYLVAFVVCDYLSLNSTTKSGVKVSVYAPPEQIQQASYALEVATEILDYYETFFGVKYPLPKQDLIAVPDFAAGAMENWGLITYRMTALLYDPEVSSASNKQWVAVVVAHELAHQWFGNLVTMQWWNDLWLNEGFASYTEYLGTDHIEPNWKMLAQYIPDTMGTALYSDSQRNSHPISVEVGNPSQISEIFDNISYDKGSCIIRMLESFIGRNVLQEGLQYYLQKHKFSNAETKDLWSAMTLTAKKNSLDVDVGKVMDTWTLQMGYPMVNVTRVGTKVTLDQGRFLLNPPSTLEGLEKSPYDYKWHIPVLYVTDQDTSASGHKLQWMEMKSAEFDLPSDVKWFKLNVKQQGFYRVNYEESDWATLIQLLHTNHTALSGADRANLLDDAFSLSRAGYMDLTTALDLSKYLGQEKEYVPWTVGLQNLQYTGMMLEQKDSFKYYAAYVKGLMQSLLTELGFNDSPNDSHLQKYLRALLLGWGVRLNDETTVNEATKMYQDWMDGKKLAPDLKNVVYKAGIQYGRYAEWNFAWNQYQNSKVPSEKRKLLYAMAGSKDAVILQKYLEFSLDESKIRKGDTVIVVSSIAANPAGRILAWNFVKHHWDTFMERYGYGSFDMASLILRTTSKFMTKYDHDDVLNFFRGHDTGSGERAVKQTLEHIQINIDWLKQNEESCVEWLKKETGLP